MSADLEQNEMCTSNDEQPRGHEGIKVQWGDQWPHSLIGNLSPRVVMASRQFVITLALAAMVASLLTGTEGFFGGMGMGGMGGMGMMGMGGMGMGGMGMGGMGMGGMGSMGMNPNLMYLMQQLLYSEQILRMLVSSTEHLQSTRDVTASMSGLASPMGNGLGMGSMAMGGMGGLGMSGYGLGSMV